MVTKKIKDVYSKKISEDFDAEFQELLELAQQDGEFLEAVIATITSMIHFSPEAGHIEHLEEDHVTVIERTIGQIFITSLPHLAEAAGDAGERLELARETREEIKLMQFGEKLDTLKSNARAMAERNGIEIK